jgi:hypothetical protein
MIAVCSEEMFEVIVGSRDIGIVVTEEEPRPIASGDLEEMS